jgi:hypothetical protein
MVVFRDVGQPSGGNPSRSVRRSVRNAWRSLVAKGG